MLLTRKEIRRNFYLRHRDEVIETAKKYYEKHKNNPEYKEKQAKRNKKWQKKNYLKRRKQKKHCNRRHRKRKIQNHKWYCKIHKLWIGEDHYCPECEAEYKNL